MSEEEKQIHLYMHSKNELGLATLCVEKDKEIERLEKELELERKSRQLLTDDLAKVCEISLKKENIINKAIEIYENRNSIEYKKKRFMEDKTIGYFMYEVLKGVDKE